MDILLFLLLLFVAQIVVALTIGSSYNLTSVPFDMTPFSFSLSTFNFLALQDVTSSSCTFPASALESKLL